MQITKEGERWLANQKTCAAFLGVSVTTFNAWNYEPIRRDRRSVLYDVRAILDDRAERRELAAEQLDLTAERARLAKEQADKTQMENAARRGELLEAAEVHKVVGRGLQTAKMRLLAIPSQLSKYLEHQDAADIQSQLDDAIYAALEELSNQPFGAEENVTHVTETEGRPFVRASAE